MPGYCYAGPAQNANDPGETAFANGACLQLRTSKIQLIACGTGSRKDAGNPASVKVQYRNVNSETWLDTNLTLSTPSDDAGRQYFDPAYTTLDVPDDPVTKLPPAITVQVVIAANTVTDPADYFTITALELDQAAN